MEKLLEYNPKLHKVLDERPEVVLELKETIFSNESLGERGATVDAATAVMEHE